MKEKEGQLCKSKNFAISFTLIPSLKNKEGFLFCFVFWYLLRNIRIQPLAPLYEQWEERGPVLRKFQKNLLMKES